MTDRSNDRTIGGDFVRVRCDLAWVPFAGRCGGVIENFVFDFDFAVASFGVGFGEGLFDAVDHCLSLTQGATRHRQHGDYFDGIWVSGAANGDGRGCGSASGTASGGCGGGCLRTLTTGTQRG